MTKVVSALTDFIRHREVIFVANYVGESNAKTNDMVEGDSPEQRVRSRTVHIGGNPSCGRSRDCTENDKPVKLS